MHINNICKSSKWQLGLIHQKLRHAPSKLHHQIYHTTTLPKFEYCCAVWDTHQQVHKQSLENVEKFAARVITTNWTANSSSLCSKLMLQPLATRHCIQSNFVTTSSTTTHASRRIPLFPILAPPPGYITLNLSSPLYIPPLYLGPSILLFHWCGAPLKLFTKQCCHLLISKYLQKSPPCTISLTVRIGFSCVVILSLLCVFCFLNFSSFFLSWLLASLLFFVIPFFPHKATFKEKKSTVDPRPRNQHKKGLGTRLYNYVAGFGERAQFVQISLYALQFYWICGRVIISSYKRNVITNSLIKYWSHDTQSIASLL